MTTHRVQDRRHSRSTDFGLRATGIVLLGIVILAVQALVAMQGNARPGVLMALLAALAFLGGSAASALLLLGHHIFDEVEISERWARPSSLPPESFPNSSGA